MMSGKKESKQYLFTISNTDTLTDYQKHILNLFKLWGRGKFELVTMLFKALFTEEEISDPSVVYGKLALAASGIKSSDKCSDMKNF